ncbi:MAG TPA: glycoside hydrolase family 18 protein [Nannocystaceae bacterium]|nr:glycoside hydrolase family 18 protein [Nannocystaceae bacterium]
MTRPSATLALALLLACAAEDPDATADDGTGSASDPTSEGGPATSSVETTATTTATTQSSTTANPTTTSSNDSTDGPSDTGSTDDATTDADDTTGGQACVDDHRVIAYLANWTECPTAEQLAQYSHVVIAFAVSYTWTPDGVICDESCNLSPVDGCLGTPLPDLVQQLHDADVEVILSFGGASMGGVWEGTCGQMTKCWDHCVDQVDSVVAQLTDVVEQNDLDGIDIDYEYCLSDPSYIDFVTSLTSSLRASLDAAFPGDHKLVTHAPMDSELEVGDEYFAIVESVASDLDFLMPQYHNGGRSPFVPEQLEQIHDHYDALVSGPFGGDASKVVFGYCIEPGCQPVATQPEAVGIAEMFDGWYPQNGGIFFWAHPNDTDAWFSQPFRQHYDETVCAP